MFRWIYLGSVYTNCQRRHCNNSAMMLVIRFSLQTMESLQNGVATHFQATSLFSMRTESLASSQSCRSIDSDAWYKWTLTKYLGMRTIVSLSDIRFHT